MFKFIKKLLGIEEDSLYVTEDWLENEKYNQRLREQLDKDSEEEYEFCQWHIDKGER